jgi:hypothetical protein
MMRRGARTYAIAGDRALLERLVDGETVETARHADAAQQGHQQRALGVALPMAVGQHAGCRQIILLVVAERDLVADEVVDRTDPLAHRQHAPSPLGDKPLDVGMLGVEQRRAAKQ